MFCYLRSHIKLYVFQWHIIFLPSDFFSVLLLSILSFYRHIYVHQSKFIDGIEHGRPSKNVIAHFIWLVHFIIAQENWSPKNFIWIPDILLTPKLPSEFIMAETAVFTNLYFKISALWSGVVLRVLRIE